MKIQQICRILILSICTSLTMVISVSGAQDSVADIAVGSFPQISVYAEAVSRIYHLPVKRTVLFFFSITQGIEKGNGTVIGTELMV